MIPLHSVIRINIRIQPKIFRNLEIEKFVRDIYLPKTSDFMVSK